MTIQLLLLKVLGQMLRVLAKSNKARKGNKGDRNETMMSKSPYLLML